MMNSSYRMTEVGLLPDDWDAKRFSECFTLVRNNTYARECLTDHPGSVANVHYGDVLIKFGAVLDFAKNAVPYLKSDVKPNKDMLRDGDLVFADTAEDEAVGKAVEVQGLKSRMAVAGLHTVASRPHDGLFAPRYLGYYINSAAYHNQLLPLITGTKVSSVSRACFLSTYVAIPPKSEQRRIAGALSDVDELISALGKLIEKKRNIKTGAMQELLTGKTRLPGFGNPETQRHEVTEFKMTELGPIPKDWEVKRLGEVSSLITKGTTPTSVGCDFECYGINFIKAESISDTGDFIPEKFAHIDEHTDMLLSRSKLKKGDFLFSIAGVLGRVALVTDEVLPANTNQALAVIRLGSNNIINKRYLFFALKSEYLRSRVKEENVAAAQANLSLQDVNDFHVAVPPLAEQKAIAAVLSDIDAEIAALEADRAKYERIKSGMMQELLTGKTRLI